MYPFHLDVRDAPLDIWGGPRVFVTCKLFFTSERKQSFFWRSTSDNFFFFSSKNFCRMLSLLCRLLFGLFSGQHIFHKCRQHVNKLFFLTFVATNYFFLAKPPRPPDIKWCVPNISVSCEITGLCTF